MSYDILLLYMKLTSLSVTLSRYIQVCKWNYLILFNGFLSLLKPLSFFFSFHLFLLVGKPLSFDKKIDIPPL